MVFDEEKAYYLHQNLRAIDHTTLLSKLTPEMVASDGDSFLSPKTIREAFAQYLVILSNTEKILADYLTNIFGDEVYMGFVHLQKLEQKLANIIVDERNKNGLYQSMEDFINRVQPSREQMMILIRIGALRFAEKEKAQLLWEAYALVAKKPPPRESRGLFSPPSKKFMLPELLHISIDDAYDEIEHIGFPVSINAFDMLQISFRGEIMARQMHEYIGKQVRMLGRLVTIKYVKTVKNEMMHFATFLDYEGQFHDSVHFPGSLKRYPFNGYGIYFLNRYIIVDSPAETRFILLDSACLPW